MADHTPGYVAALAAALHQANIDALNAAQNGDNQLGRPVAKQPGLRIWNGQPLRVGHHPKTQFAVEVNAIVPDSMNRHVAKAFHEHVHLEHLTPPPGYDDDPTVLSWVFCGPDADGAVPITIGVFEMTDEDVEGDQP
jgi:hypothetical protein